MRNIIRSLSVVVALILVMTLSFSVLAEESSAVSADASADASVDASANESKDESADASKDASKDAPEDASKHASKDASKDASKAEDNHDHDHDHEAEVPANDFPWARVITLIAIVVLGLVAFILTKTNTALGQKIKKFCKEYWSEIKKVSWYSPKDTAKATGIVLVFLIVAAVAVGVLDFGFSKLVELLANIF